MGIISTASKVGGKLVKFEKLGKGKYLSKVPVPTLTKTGAAAIIGIGAINSTKSGFDNYAESKMGTIDNQIQSATPYINEEKKYDYKSSVDGSLAFALHNNRFG